MKIISYGWTWPALAAGRKTCTRRAWTPEYAKRFHAGELVQPYDRSPRFRGKQIISMQTGKPLLVKLIAKPTFEPMINMPDSDYEAEGFAYLNENKHLLPKSMPYDVSLAGFRDWQNDGSSLWVVRFKMVELL